MSRDIHTEFTTAPAGQDIEFLTRKINEETPEYGTAYPFAFFIRDDHNQIIAGCNGSVVFGAIYTDQLWVDKHYRSQGLGTQLMQQVHDYGRSIGCIMATVNTMSFQKAVLFYEALGYVVDFERSGYAHQSNCIFLRKDL
ncbi:MAG: GNAT family N-acetyltransferase [Pseudomonadota bacterium]